MAEGEKSMERGQHVSFERLLDTPYIFSPSLYQGIGKQTMLDDSLSLKIACFGCTDAQEVAQAHWLGSRSSDLPRSTRGVRRGIAIPC